MTTKILTGVYGATYNLASPVTTLSIASTGYLEGGVASSGVAAYTVVNAGHLAGKYFAVTLAGAGVVTNSANVQTTSSISGAGIMLGDGGSVTNAKGARIFGAYEGVVIAAAAGAVTNQGSIIGAAGAYAIDLAAGGLVVNGGTANTGAFVRGKNAAIAAGLAATIYNYGSVLATGTAGAGWGVYLKQGGLVANGSAGDTAAVIEGYIAGVECAGGAVNVNNFGTIRGDGATGGGVVLAGGTVTNGGSADTTAVIEGEFGVGAATAAATVINFGTVAGSYSVNGLDIAVVLSAGGVVTNGSTGDLSARIGATVGVLVKGAAGIVNNFGTIGGFASAFGAALQAGGRITNGAAGDTTALIEGSVGVAGQSMAATVVNFGSIIGDVAGGPTPVTYRDGVLLQAGGIVTNGSSVDTAALIKGYIGAYSQTIAATASNFGEITGSVAGVVLLTGGRVTNGSASDTGARISGVKGVDIEGGAGAVANFGSIVGGVANGWGAKLTAGAISNGSSTDHTALIQGYVGVYASAAKVTNDATISGGSAPGSIGVVAANGASVVNNAGAMIDGFYGLSAGATCTVTNFGTIKGASPAGIALFFTDSTARINLEAGSTVVGVINARGGVIDVVGGVATASGVGSFGKIIGAGTLNLAGGNSRLDAGASLAVAEIVDGPGETVTITTKLIDSRIWRQTGGSLVVNSGDQITFTGTANRFTGAISGSGTAFFSGGSETFANVDISAAKTVINKAAVTFSGTVGMSGTVSAIGAGLVVAAGGATFSGGGELSLSNSAANSLHGASSTATLTNGDTIRGAGHLGGGVMTLVNAAAGVIEGVGSAGLVIDTGAKTITNAGVVEALTGNVTTLASAVANSGTLASRGGTLAVNVAVTGLGVVQVFGGVASFASSFNEQVAFGSTGRLILAHSQTFTSTISGFSHKGTTSLDLKDITRATATATYSGTTASGILTVTDGGHTAKIHLIGDYTAATWTLSADSGGGTIIVDPTAARPHAIIAAMASLAPSPAAGQPWHTPPPAPPMVLHGG